MDPEASRTLETLLPDLYNTVNVAEICSENDTALNIRKVLKVYFDIKRSSEYTDSLGLLARQSEAIQLHNLFPEKDFDFFVDQLNIFQDLPNRTELVLRLLIHDSRTAGNDKESTPVKRHISVSQEVTDDIPAKIRRIKDDQSVDSTSGSVVTNTDIETNQIDKQEQQLLEVIEKDIVQAKDGLEEVPTFFESVEPTSDSDSEKNIVENLKQFAEEWENLTGLESSIEQGDGSVGANLTGIDNIVNKNSELKSENNITGLENPISNGSARIIEEKSPNKDDMDLELEDTSNGSARIIVRKSPNEDDMDLTLQDTSNVADENFNLIDYVHEVTNAPKDAVQRALAIFYMALDVTKRPPQTILTQLINKFVTESEETDGDMSDTTIIDDSYAAVDRSQKPDLNEITDVPNINMYTDNSITDVIYVNTFNINSDNKKCETTVARLTEIANELKQTVQDLSPRLQNPNLDSVVASTSSHNSIKPSSHIQLKPSILGDLSRPSTSGSEFSSAASSKPSSKSTYLLPIEQKIPTYFKTHAFWDKVSSTTQSTRPQSINLKQTLNSSQKPNVYFVNGPRSTVVDKPSTITSVEDLEQIPSTDFIHNDNDNNTNLTNKIYVKISGSNVQVANKPSILKQPVLKNLGAIPKIYVATNKTAPSPNRLAKRNENQMQHFGAAKTRRIDLEPVQGLVEQVAVPKTADTINNNNGHLIVPTKPLPSNNMDEEEATIVIGPAQPSTSGSVDQKLVNCLCEVFPTACPEYLNNLCKGRNMDNETVDQLVTSVLRANGDYPKRRAKTPEPEVYPDDQLDILQEFLPDADPDFLKRKCEEFQGKPELVKLFINDAMERHDYPTMKDYQRRQQLSAQQRQYTTEFSVENFIKLIPDPNKFFSDPSRVIPVDVTSSHYAQIFLRNTFDRLPIRTIQSCFLKKRANIYKTAMQLKKMSLQPSMLLKSRRKPVSLPNSEQNIPLLQEIAYVTHENEIIEHLKQIKAKEEIEFAEARQHGLLTTCNCCFDEEVLPRDTFTCNNGCVFCKACLVKSTEVLFGEGKLEFPCLSNCSAFFKLQTLQAALTPKFFSILAQKKAVAEVKAAGIEELEMCPFCDFATIPPDGDKIFHCLNPQCMKESCRLCKEPSHIPLRCEEIEKDADVKARVFVENKMTEALLKKCYKCGIKFFKEEGCNKMTCSCGAHMCYVCGVPVTDYKHFNGNGGDRFDLCPLYSNTNDLNKKNVIKGAEEAKAELGNQDLKIDPTKDIQDYYKNREKQLPREFVMGAAGVAAVAHLEERMRLLRAEDQRRRAQERMRRFENGEF